MESQLEERVAQRLRNARVHFEREPALAGLRPDFVVQTESGPVVIEVKARLGSRTEWLRALEVANRFREATDAYAALVVSSDVSMEGQREAVVPLSKLVGRLRKLGATTKSKEEQLTPFESGSVELRGKAASSTFALLSDQLMGRGRTLPGRSRDGSRSKTGKTPQLFVAMPFAPDFDDVYFIAAREVAKRRGMAALRIDRSYFDGEIAPRLRRELRKSKAVLADVSGANPNVLYEVGFAHGLSIPMVQICRTPLSKLPFDVRGWNTIRYRAGQTHALVSTLDSALTSIGI